MCSFRQTTVSWQSQSVSQPASQSIRPSVHSSVLPSTRLLNTPPQPSFRETFMRTRWSSSYYLIPPVSHVQLGGTWLVADGACLNVKNFKNYHFLWYLMPDFNEVEQVWSFLLSPDVHVIFRNYVIRNYEIVNFVVPNYLIEYPWTCVRAKKPYSSQLAYLWGENQEDKKYNGQEFQLSDKILIRKNWLQNFLPAG